MNAEDQLLKGQSEKKFHYEHTELTFQFLIHPSLGLLVSLEWNGYLLRTVQHRSADVVMNFKHLAPKVEFVKRFRCLKCS